DSAIRLPIVWSRSSSRFCAPAPFGPAPLKRCSTSSAPPGLAPLKRCPTSPPTSRPPTCRPRGGLRTPKRAADLRMRGFELRVAHALAVDRLVAVRHLERRPAGDQHLCDRLNRDRHVDAIDARIMADHFDAPCPERRRLREPPFNPDDIAIVRIDVNRPVHEEHVLA